jgi:tRNA pseudouridine55 synthase
VEENVSGLSGINPNDTNPFAQGKFLLIDKPLRWTSFDAVRRIRKLVKTKKVGHAGTLDPLATGLLIICTGKFTKKINEYMAREKEYTGTITLGAVTPTFDLESEPEQENDFSAIQSADLEAATKNFIGQILQVPPMHSAIKVNGKRLYELARQGKDIKPDPRSVTISTFEITSVEMPVVSFRVVCSTGTYIRSLANDFGASLGVGGYLSSLRRTRIGEFSVSDAFVMEDAEAMISKLLDGEVH